MKITREYLRTIIKEEIYNLSTAADRELDKITSDEYKNYGVDPTDKPTIDSLQDTILQLKKLKTTNGTTDNDMNAVVDMSPEKVKTAIRRRYNNRISKDSIK